MKTNITYHNSYYYYFLSIKPGTVLGTLWVTLILTPTYILGTIMFPMAQREN